jgi:hypothetical protein
MDKNLELQLVKEFPQLFTDYYSSPIHSNMCFGCECGNGWYDLLHELCRKIMLYNPPQDLKFTQVKEKYGLLVVYVNSYPMWLESLVEWAEIESASICEECGSTENAETRGNHWLKTLCLKCHEKEQNLLNKL